MGQLALVFDEDFLPALGILPAAQADLIKQRAPIAGHVRKAVAPGRVVGSEAGIGHPLPQSLIGPWLQGKLRHAVFYQAILNPFVGLHPGPGRLGIGHEQEAGEFALGAQQVRRALEKGETLVRQE